MASDQWKAGSDVMQTMRNLISQFHPDLAMIEDEISIIFKEKASTAAGKKILGKTRKAPPLLPILTDKQFQYRFVIELAADEWQTLDNKQQEALIDHHLCSIMIEENEETGDVKYSLRPPDFVGYKDEVARHGMWRPMDDDTINAVDKAFREVLDAPQKRAASSDVESLLES